jgi:hypothetical protein
MCGSPVQARNQNDTFDLAFRRAEGVSSGNHLTLGQVKIMSLVTEILSLRQNRSSSVKTLIAMLDWQRAAQDDGHILSRGFAVTEAADLVLLNVAAHSMEAFSEPPAIRRTRRTAPSSRRKRHFDPGPLHQRRLFAPTAG